MLRVQRLPAAREHLLGQLVPALGLPPPHHLAKELDELLVTIEVDVGPQVGVAGAVGQVVLVLADHVGAGLASPACGLVLFVSRVVPGHSQHEGPHFPSFSGSIEVTILHIVLKVKVIMFS